MTGQQIDRDRLRELAENATPGPWFPHARYVWTSDLGGIIRNWSEDANGAADMDFIAYTRTAVPALLDENAALRARIKAVRELHTPAKLKEHTGTSWYTDPDDHLVCAHCTDPDGGGYATYPCETLQALDGEG